VFVLVSALDVHKFTVWFVLQPDTVTGDIVFVVQQKEHPKFKRKGDDLFYEHTLSLTEALCGFQLVLTHLDNRQLLVKSNPGEVVKPGKTLASSCVGLFRLHICTC
jgi:DnaJ family protein A protein 2